MTLAVSRIPAVLRLSVALPVSGCPLALLPPLLALLVMAAIPARRPVAEASAAALTYTIRDENYSWVVHQGAELTVVRTSGSPEDGGGEIVMVAGPAVGGAPASKVGNVPVLARALGGPATLGPGHVSRSVYEGTAVLDSFRVTLRPGTRPATIDGRTTSHRVLTLESWWIDRPGDGSRTPVREIGRADLWFAADLPFSLIPLTAPPPPGRVAGALPLSGHRPEVAAHVLEQVIGELEPLGLLLRARVLDSVVPQENPAAEIGLAGGVYARSIDVDAIRSVTEEPSAPEFTGLPVLTASQGLALEIGMIVAGEPCNMEPTGGSFEFSTSGSAGFMAGGSGAALRDGEALGHASVVLGGRGTTMIECTLVILSDSARAPGRYQVVAPAPTAFAGAAQEAIVVHILANPTARALTRFLALDQGEVRLERADGRMAKGVIKGSGWAVELDPRYRRRVHQSLGFDAMFEAVAGGVGGGE